MCTDKFLFHVDRLFTQNGRRWAASALFFNVVWQSKWTLTNISRENLQLLTDLQKFTNQLKDKWKESD